MDGLLGACQDGVAAVVTGRGRRWAEAPPRPRKALFRATPRPAIRKGFAERRTGTRTGRPHGSTGPARPGIATPGRPPEPPGPSRDRAGPPEQRKGHRYDLCPARVNRHPDRFPRPARDR
ncbi:hypothetical protein GCM10018781_33320 [Kitasatospora indigofera]|uniref:Uncharacterized protein n=1 Tax=Kitasatospora indigofera TaxID=67307 RepID=A0A919KSQ6_9ACTN|nr:hypothetical protein GCM10018781_33320 [Kitasatospora indigofera]